MELVKLRDLPGSFKTFIGLMMCLVGLNYLALLAGIWIDTEMRIANVIEGYGTFEFIELVEHSFRYLFWFIAIFGITVSLFLITSRSEKVKKFFAVAVPLLIVSDIGSMWLIRYSPFFAHQLYASGILLASGFCVMLFCIQQDIWLHKVKVVETRRNKSSSPRAVVSEEIQELLEGVMSAH